MISESGENALLAVVSEMRMKRVALMELVPEDARWVVRGMCGSVAEYLERAENRIVEVINHERSIA